MPFLYLISVFPLVKIRPYIIKNSKIKKKVLTLLTIILLILLMIPNLIWSNNLIEAKKTSYSKVKLAGEWIKENSNPEDIIISSSLPQTTYYAERTTYPYHLGYRRDIARSNISEVEEFIETERPRYVIASIFEAIPDLEYWTVTYPQEHQDLLTPVKVYAQNDQPVLIIYEVKQN